MFRKTFGVWWSFKHINPQWSTLVFLRTGKCDECDHSTIVRYLHSMCNVKKSGVWVLHALSQKHKNLLVAICATLLARHQLARKHQSFLPCIVTGDKKWCLYANIRKIKKWLSPNKRRILEMFKFLHFLASMVPLTIFKWQNFNM